MLSTNISEKNPPPAYIQSHFRDGSPPPAMLDGFLYDLEGISRAELRITTVVSSTKTCHTDYSMGKAHRGVLSTVTRKVVSC